MNVKELLKLSDLLQVALGLATLVIIFRRRLFRDFKALATMVLFYTVCSASTVSLLFYRRALHIPRETAFHVYLTMNWSTSIAEFLVQVFVIYGLFVQAMSPFPGLHRIGQIVFRWVGIVSLLVSFALAAGPELFARGIAASQIISEVDGRLQQGIGVLILCLLIFVSFSIRPLGLTFRSHLFGVVLGMAVISSVQLIQAAWLATVGAEFFYSPIYLFGSLGDATALSIWLVYFALPEPKRKMILLPTTSPFFHWNRISEILGDAPGHVAVAGFTPDMLAPAEIEVLTAATRHETAYNPLSERAGVFHPAEMAALLATAELPVSVSADLLMPSPAPAKHFGGDFGDPSLRPLVASL